MTEETGGEAREPMERVADALEAALEASGRGHVSAFALTNEGRVAVNVIAWDGDGREVGEVWRWL